MPVQVTDRILSWQGCWVVGFDGSPIGSEGVGPTCSLSLGPGSWSLGHLMVLLLLLPAFLAFLGRFQLICGWGGGQSSEMGPGSGGAGGRKAWSGTGAGNRRFFQISSTGQAARAASVRVCVRVCVCVCVCYHAVPHSVCAYVM